MQNAKKPSLIDTIDYKRDVVPYKFIKIYAGVGSGKTQLACNMILGNKEKGIPEQTVLLITSRRSTVKATLEQTKDKAVSRAKAFGNLPGDAEWYKEDYDEYDQYVRIIKENEDLLLGDSRIHNKSVVCTNAHIEQYFKKEYEPAVHATHLWEQFDTIIVDEVHSLITDATYQSAPFYVLELINEFLQRYTKHTIQNREKKRLILMTGTPEPLEKLQIVPFDDKLSVTYDFFDKCPNVQPKTVTVIDTNSAITKLQTLLASNEKALYFCNHVMTKQLVRDSWKIKDSVGIEVSFSSDEKKKIIGKKAAEEIEKIDKFIAKNRRLRDDVHLFVTTSRNKEGINIENEDIRYMFVESHFSDDVVQMAGRLRVGVENLYIISDKDQMGKGASAIAVDFTSKGIAPPLEEFSDKNQGYANEYLLALCKGRKNAESIPFNTESEHKANDYVSEYIEYIHDVFPYARYSYLLNRFVYYKQKTAAEEYTLGKCNSFSNALIAGNDTLKELIQGWFPNASIAPLLSDETRCKEYIEQTIFGNNPKCTWVKITSKQYAEIQRVFSEIKRKPISYVNKILEEIGYTCGKRRDDGCYEISRKDSKKRRSIRKKGGKRK